MALITLVEHDDESRKRLARVLRADGFDVIEVSDGLEALRTAFASRPEAALVDLRARGVDGYELIRILRAACDLPIVALGEECTPTDVIRALEAGADDVVDKTCLATELLARMHAAMRRYQRSRQQQSVTARKVLTGTLEIDRDVQVVRKRGKVVQLTRTEYRLVDAMADRLGETAPHRYLLGSVWGDEYVDDTRYLRVYVGYLRQKLEDDPSSPQYFVNEWGLGYRLARLPVEVDDSMPIDDRHPAYA